MTDNMLMHPLDHKERRKRRREGIAILLLTLLFMILTFAEFRLTNVSSALPFVNSIFFFGLLNVNLILLIALVWLVARNVGKLFIERRRKILGARLKTKLVIAFLAFSIIPTLVLFLISALYINSSFDKWFSLKIQNTLESSLEITRTYYRNTSQTAMHFAEHIAGQIGKHLDIAEASGEVASQLLQAKWIKNFLNSQRELLALDAVEFYADPLAEIVVSYGSDVRDSHHTRHSRIALDSLKRAYAGESVTVIEHVGLGDVIRCLVPVRNRVFSSISSSSKIMRGVIVVSDHIPVSLVNKVDEIASVFDDYKDTNPLKYPMKTTYLVILIMITLVIIFVAIWIGLYMARELTVPVERLVSGVQAVGAGNLDFFITASGDDEITVLVESFNKMTKDLRENQQRLIQAGADLEKRRCQLEAIVGNIGTGVIAIGSTGEITTFNSAAARLLQIDMQHAHSQTYQKIFKGDSLPLLGMIERALTGAKNGESTFKSNLESTQLSFLSGEIVKVLAVMATPLKESETQWGAVLVIDDMTHLIKAQREMAWREVARRIAHEIKNPLTPIKLSAQRLQRRMGSYLGRDAELLQECTETIIKHSDELKEMVNEFSHFARFPEVSPALNDLHGALLEVVRLYSQAHSEIDFHLEQDSKLPIFEFDRDQIKRVIINLLENSVSALKHQLENKEREILLATHYNEELQIAVIEVADNGPGMSEEVKDRVFEPYFSTKKEGTGLGLAIAKRIINDHDGFIRVHSTVGTGTRFLIELPTASRHESRGLITGLGKNGRREREYVSSDIGRR